MDPVVLLSLGRVGAGALSLARPELAAKALGLDTAADPRLGLVTRMFGSREVALGVLTLLSRGPARQVAVAVGVAVDGADLAVSVSGGNEGTIPRSTAAVLSGVAGGAVVTGVLALAGALGRRTPAVVG